MINFFSRSKYIVTRTPDTMPANGGMIKKLCTLLKSVSSLYKNPTDAGVPYHSHAAGGIKISGIRSYREGVPEMSTSFRSAAGVSKQIEAASPRFAQQIIGNFSARHATPVFATPFADDIRDLQSQRMDAVDKLMRDENVGFLDRGAAIGQFTDLRMRMGMRDPSEKNFRESEKSLIALLASHLQPEAEPGKASGRGQSARAKALYRAAVVQSLNARPWNTILARFDVMQNDRNVGYTSRMTPAAQMKLGEHNIFAIDYAERGVSSGSSKNASHASNLWLSEFHVSNPAGTAGPATEQALFRGVRHGINSAYGLKPGAERTMGAENRAREVVTAALYLDRDKLHRALAGEMVDLRISSTSLVTAANFPGLSTEGGQFEDQRKAWETLSKQSPCALQIRDADGMLKDVRINLEIAVFNFGVNEAALNFKAGWGKSDKQNLQGLRQLLGDDLHPGAAIGGWVGDYLANPATPKNAALVKQLSGQIREIWQQKSHRRQGGEPYKLAQRIALLSNAIDVVPCYNCKSGKDRTGMLDTELKRELVQLHGGAGLSAPGEKLSAENQRIFQQILDHSGNAEIQTANTGAPGNKVIRKHPGLGYSFSERLRVGDAAAIARISGLSSLV